MDDEKNIKQGVNLIFLQHCWEIFQEKVLNNEINSIEMIVY